MKIEIEDVKCIPAVGDANSSTVDNFVNLLGTEADTTWYTNVINSYDGAMTPKEKISKALASKIEEVCSNASTKSRLRSALNTETANDSVWLGVVKSSVLPHLNNKRNA